MAKQRFTDEELSGLKSFIALNQIDEETFMGGINLLYDCRVKIIQMVEKLQAVDPSNSATLAMAGLLSQVVYICQSTNPEFPLKALSELSKIALDIFKETASPSDMFEVMANIGV